MGFNLERLRSQYHNMVGTLAPTEGRELHGVIDVWCGLLAVPFDCIRLQGVSSYFWSTLRRRHAHSGDSGAVERR